MTLERNRRDLLRTIPGIAAAGLGLPGVAASQEGDGGEELWRFETGGDVSSSPTVVDGSVFFGSQDDGVYALDAATGAREWRYATGANVYSSPTVVDGTLYVGSADATLYALDAATGDQQWTFSAGAPVDASPTVADGTVFVGSWGDEVHALDAATGEEVWQFETDGSVDSSATVVDGTVFVGSKDAGLYALDSTTGEQQWVFPTGDDVDSSPTVADGTVFVGSADGNVYAIDAATGEERWRYQTGGDVESSPTVADGAVFVGGGNATIYALDVASGDLQWQFQSRLGVESAPTVAGDTVFVGSVNHALFALDAATGEEEWAFDADSVVDSSPTVVDGVVFFGTVDGSLVAVEAGVDGSSRGSRVLLGTLGHHHEWAGESPQTVEAPEVDLSVEHLRLVQTVEHTRALSVRDTEGRFADAAPVAESLVLDDDHPDVSWSAPDPPFAAGRSLAPVFDLSVSSPESGGVPVTVRGRLLHEGESLLERGATLSAEALAGQDHDRRNELEGLYSLDVPDRLPLLEVLAGNPDLVDGEYPALPAGGGFDVEVEVDARGMDEPVTETVSIDPDRVVSTPELTIGLIPLEKGAVTSEGSYRFNGEPDVLGFAEAVASYVLDTYPVTAVTVAAYDSPVTGPSANLPIAPNRAATIADRKLNARLDDTETFTLHDDGQRTDDVDVAGVDVTLGVVPQEEFFGGFLQGPDRYGTLPVANGEPVADAALVEIGHPVPGAHELGHFFLGLDYFDHPDLAMDGDDPAHAAQDLRSTGFVHRDGDLRVHPARTSLMHDSGEQWTDARTYRGLVESDFRPFAQPGTIPVPSLSYQRDADRQLSEAATLASAADASAAEPPVDPAALMDAVEDLRSSLGAELDGVERYWEAPEGLASEQWEEVGDLAGDLDRLGEALAESDPEFLSDAVTTTVAVGERLRGVAADLEKRAQRWLSEGQTDVLEVLGTLEGDVDLSTEVLRVVGPVESTDGDAEVVVRDAEGTVLGEDALATDVELHFQDGERRSVEGAVAGVVALPPDAATVEVTASGADGATTAAFDPTTAPIREAVEALPERAFADGDARAAATETLDRIGEDVAAGNRAAATDRLEALYRDLVDAIGRDYEPEAADEPARAEVLARVGQQLQRFGGEVPDAPGDGGDGTGDGEEETGEGGSGTGGDGGSGTWLLALGGVAVGGYAVKRLWDDREPVEPEE